MATIKLPQAGKNMQAGTVRRWRKQAGEAVAKGDVLLEVETDEALIEVESAVAGVLAAILVPAGRTVAVGTPLAELGPAGSKIQQPAVQTRAAATAAVPPPATSEPQTKSATMSTTKPAATPAGPVIPVVMPKAGQSMEEGTLVKWRVQPGATIAKGDIIFEIETDKATMEVEATDAGRLARIVLSEGATCKVLEPVAYLAASEADVEAYLARAGGGASTEGPQSEAAMGATGSLLPVHGGADAVAAGPGSKLPVAPGGRVKASPAARKVAAERGIDLGAVAATLAGSGPGGRILSTDVPRTAPAIAAAKPQAAATAAPALAPASEGVVRKKMSQMRKAIARNLLLSKQTIPHFYVRATLDAAPLVGFYQGEKAKYPCSLNDVIVAACAKLLMEFPAFRSRIDGDDLLEYPTANVGVAVGLDTGLVVPVLVGAEQMTLKQIGSETKRLAALARGGKIEGMGLGLFTITNLGMFGVEEFAAIINPPEAAILAVGAARESVIVSGGTLRPGRTMTLTLSADHRIIDGTLAAKFMARLREVLEWPGQLVA